jgi:opacity protein-like surface antigen
MKKVMILSALLVMFSTSVFAADTITMDLSAKTTTGLSLYGDSSAASSSTALIGKTSTGVGLSLATATVGYALSTQHMNGSKAFASSFDSTSIFSEDVATIGTVELNVTASDTSEFSDWKPL